MKKLLFYVFALLLACLFVLTACDPKKDTDPGGEDHTAQQTVGDPNVTGNGSAVHTHSYTQKNTDPTYLKFNATCRSAAVYYYSCTCGAMNRDTFTSGSPTEHNYVASVVAATCKNEGYTIYSCDCGTSYKANYTAKTHNHDFQSGRVERDGMSYDAFVCRNCALEAVQYGNADGSWFRDADCKYYITGDILNRKDYEIVVYGTGNMPDYSNNNNPVWFEYLLSAKKIIIADGITSIGAYAFYNSNSTAKVEYSVSDTVKTIKPYALGLKTTNLVLGKSVQRIESNGILYDQVQGGVYLPKSVVYMAELSGNVTYFYEGSIQAFYSITTSRYNQTITLERFFSYWDDPASNFNIYVNATSINDRGEYWQ